MKKIILTLITITILSMNFQIPIIANELEIEGLEENLNELFMENYFTEEQFKELDRQYVEWFDGQWESELAFRKKFGKMKYRESEEKEYEYRLSESRPDFTRGIRVTMLKSIKYSSTYTYNNNFNYLFSGDEYWAICDNGGLGDSWKINLDGIYIPGDEIANKTNYDYSAAVMYDRDIDFIKDKKNTKNMLLEKSETKINDIKIFATLNQITLMYIDCGENKYLVKIHGNFGTEDECLIEYGKLYSIEEMLNAITYTGDYEYKHRQVLIERILAEKPTFDTEAESLQAEGLLNGNENGLDLLKPLTRIEAAAMILRAMGESEDSTGETVFSDVPLTHWGNGAANKAHSLGIIKGVGDNQFAPDEQVSAEQFSTMVLRAANISDFDWKEALNILIEKGIITSENSKTMDFFTRGDMAKIIYEARAKGFLN